MLIPQLITGVVLFLILYGSFPPEPVIALFLLYLILVSAGFVSSRGRIRLPLLIFKAAFCVLLTLETPLVLLILPFVCLELPEITPVERRFLLPWIICAALPAAPAFFLPGELLLPYTGLWAAAVCTALKDRQHRRTLKQAAGRVLTLERELAVSEYREAALEKAGAQQEILIKFQERDRIAQALHDQLGHTMTGSIMQLEAAGLLFQDEPDRARESINTVSRTLKEGLSSIRMSLKALKPEPADLGLGSLRSLLNDFEREHGITANLVTEGPVETLPPPLWPVIKNNLTEALTNILRHSSGRRFSCRITVLNQLYRVEFRDDGVITSPMVKGMGLEGMEKRVSEAGGTLIIDTTRGFSVIMLFQKGAL